MADYSRARYWALKVAGKCADCGHQDAADTNQCVECRARRQRVDRERYSYTPRCKVTVATDSESKS